jgi:hypothetical protein
MRKCQYDFGGNRYDAFEVYGWLLLDRTNGNTLLGEYRERKEGGEQGANYSSI